MKIGGVLKNMRERAGLSQKELAGAAGISRVYLWQLESDKKSPTLDVFFTVCKALRVSPALLVRKIEDANRNESQ
jgi:transcriptional regulator with XRE-family HTH domain